MCPITLPGTRRIPHVGEIVSGEGNHGSGVSDEVIRSLTLPDGYGKVERLLYGSEFVGSTDESNKRAVEVVQPRAEPLRCVPFGIDADHDNLDLVRRLWWQFVQHGRDVRHVDRAYVGTVRVAEEQERDISLSLCPKIERFTRRRGEGEICLGQWLW